MGDTNEVFEKAVSIVKEAIAAETNGDYRLAHSKYISSLEYFVHTLKYEKNPQKKALIKKYADDYMTRAEELREYLENEKNKPKKNKKKKKKKKKKATDDDDNDDEGDSSDEDESKEDKEEKKMAGQLAESIVSEKPNISWDDVAGLASAKQSLKEAVTLPRRFPQLFTGKRKPWKGILFYGPPGTGKTYLAKALATEEDSTFFNVSSAQLVSKWQGESEKQIMGLFKLARAKAPSIIFIDEIDSMCTARNDGENEASRRIKTQFLVQMDGVVKNKGSDGGHVLLLGATNTPWDLDTAILRRFDKRIYLGLPGEAARQTMFRIHLGKTPHNLTDADFRELAKITDKYSGSDISTVVKEALMEPIRKCNSAKFFKVDPETKRLSPVDQELDPPCPMCVPNLSTTPPALLKSVCSNCSCQRITLWEIAKDDAERLEVPPISIGDFRTVIGNGGAKTVDETMLNRFVEWTHEHGQSGA